MRQLLRSIWIWTKLNRKCSSHMSRIFQAGIAETAALGRARGVALPEDMAAQVWQAMQDLPDELRASTAIELEE